MSRCRLSQSLQSFHATHRRHPATLPSLTMLCASWLTKRAFCVCATQDERPTQVLWVGLPGGTKVSDTELHNAFLPCGGLERVKSFSERNYAFVQFKTVEAATHAKAVMQARSGACVLYDAVC
jgi:hypothetical protein